MLSSGLIAVSWDPTITAAVITAIAAIVVGIATGIVGPLVVKSFELRGLQPITSARGKALSGTWEGTVQNRAPARNSNSADPVTIELSVSKKLVTGTAELNATFEGKQHRIKLDLRGGFYYERFLRLDYANKDDAIVQFGAIVLELDEESRQLCGRYTGFGQLTKSIVSGDALLKKAS